LAVGCIALALSCGLAAVAVRQGVITPPDISVELGGVRIVGVTTNSPECTQLIALGCIAQNPKSVTRIYTLWLLARSEQDTWNRPDITQLLAIKIGGSR
jgi:hypothetical protein